ncbi:MAG TPA: hypothetical protein VGG50_07335 [Streptosporangiaceae bacterium]
MPRVPRGLHFQVARRQVSKLVFRPGWQGTGMQPIRRPPVGRYSQVTRGVPLTGGQGTAKVSSGGTATVSIGPQGLGTVWYPAAANLATTTGAADNSTCIVYLGPAPIAVNQQGQSYSGGGDTIGLSVPSLTPGALLTAVWSGGHAGDTATLNIVGTMDALTT